MKIQPNKPYIFYLLAFGVPVFSMLCIFAGNQIYPFGDNCFLRTDLYHQYAPFYAELCRKLHKGGSLFFTFDIGMGTNFLSLIGYYLSSIFNILLFIIPEESIIEYISYMAIIKIGLSGLTFSYFLYKRHNHLDYSMTLFGLFYAMSGYIAAYSWNVMWLDCIWLTPLILLGIENLTFRKRNTLYIISLALAIISNYYIAIMICIFCVIYFLMQLVTLILENGNWYKACLRFSFSSLIAGGLSAFILLPEIKAFSLTASSDISFPKEWSSYFNIFEMLGRHLINVTTENGLDHWPNIYCGVGILLCIPLYYLSKKVPLNKKITYTSVAFFFLFSFSLNVPNFIWHGFHYPNSLPCRQSFLYIAIVLVMCYEGIEHIEEFNSRIIGFAFFAATAFIILSQAILDDDAFDFSSFWLSLIFIGIETIILLVFFKLKNFKPVIISCLIICTFIEATTNMALTSVTTVSRSEYLSYKNSYSELIKLTTDADDSFYRFEKVARKTKNDGAFVGYPSLSTFSSVSYGNVSKFYKNLGMESSMNAYSNNGITPLMNSLFDVRYILSTTKLQESQLTSLYEQNEECYVYENLYTMNLGFMLPKDFNKKWDIENSDAFDIQNSFSKLNGCKNIFYQIYDFNISDDTMTISPSETSHIFIKLENSSIENVTVNINEDSKEYTNTDRGFLIDLGYCSPKDDIRITTSDDTTFRASAYYLNESEFIKLIKKFKKQELNISNWSDTLIEGNINADSDGTFFLSLPYDPGWTLYVDGQKYDYYKFKDSFISCDLKKGKHDIKLIYRPEGFNAGLLISIISLLILLFYKRILIMLKKISCKH